MAGLTLPSLDAFFRHATLKIRRTIMQLLTEELRASLPPLNAQDGNKDPFVHAKFFTPDAGWTWFVTEGDAEGDDFHFFGYVIGEPFIGLEEEWGYFSLSELNSTCGCMGLDVERDLYFEQGPWSEVIARYQKERGEQV